MSSRMILARIPVAHLIGPTLLSLALAAPLGAQAGQLDPTFGHGGKLMVDFNLSTDLARAVALQPDGKIVVVGTTYINNDFSEEDFAVSRHLPDGTFDPSFGGGDGKVTTNFPGLAAVASSVVVQPDGKILVAGGAFPNFTFLGDIAVVRYNPDGSLDTGFGNGGIVLTSFPGQGSYAFALALQPDGMIVAAGTHFINFQPSEQTSDTNFALVRYHPDGSLDTSFGNLGGGVSTDFDGNNDDAFSILVQPDGKLVAVGSALNLADFYNFAAARYLPDGSLDPNFGTGGKVRLDFGNHDFDRAQSAALQPDGKIVAAGFAISDGGFSQPFALARWDANGALDSSFGGGDGMVDIDFGSFFQAAYEVIVQPDGKIVTAGYPNSESSDSDFLIARCLTDGTLDPSFGTGGKVRTSFGDLNGGAEGAALAPDGRIVAVGWQAIFADVSVQFALARYRGDAAWADQGLPLPGTLGAPVLSGTGDLNPSTAASIELANALPNALAALFAAASSSPVPFKGGVLQPNPFLGPFLVPTGAAGAITINFTVPASLPSGAQIWLQWAIKDPGAVQGVALSNAITGFVP
jgi:uncharacterized delta-60 repeat protein